eukprot:GEMP01043685.1.p1 GENE.GEMP01043685.1~~GEMP01043685.1.p1  ORF type:complete len:304 (+),score=65.04 GEMP01043685.1:92-1003(+)
MAQRTNTATAENHVNCGTSKANLCSDCGVEDSCGGDCEWRYDLCQPIRPVLCGNHAADICAVCPGKGGRGTCAGDCLLTNGKCELRTDLGGMKGDEIAALVIGIFFVIIFVVLLILWFLTSRRIARAEKRERLSHRPRQLRASVVENREIAQENLKVESIELARQTLSSEAPLANEQDIEAAKLEANPNLDDDPDRKDRVPMKSEAVELGTRVVRGPDWEFQEQDGGKGQVGVVRAIPCNGWVMVKWKKNGKMHAYKTGKDGCFHLSPAPPRPSKGGMRGSKRPRRKQPATSTLNVEDLEVKE